MRIHIQKIHNQNPGFIVINNCLTWQLETENGFSKVQSVQVQKLSPISQVVRLLNNKFVVGRLREESYFIKNRCFWLSQKNHKKRVEMYIFDSYLVWL